MRDLKSKKIGSSFSDDEDEVEEEEEEEKEEDEEKDEGEEDDCEDRDDSSNKGEDDCRGSKVLVVTTGSGLFLLVLCRPACGSYDFFSLQMKYIVIDS